MILGYAFIAACAPSCPEEKHNNLEIRVTPAYSRRGLQWPREDKHGAWGTESMSRILRINHQLRSEANDVLYGGDFVFYFLASHNTEVVDRWLHIIGDKKTLMTKVGVSNHVYLGGPRMTEATGRGAEVFATLRRELVNLKSLEMRIVFERTPYGAPESEEVRQLVYDALANLVGVFRGLATLVIENKMLPDAPCMRLFATCVERMEEAVK